MNQNEINQEQQKREKLQREHRLDDIRAVMATPAGRRFIWQELDRGNIFRKCFTGNATTHYLEGKREHTLELYQDVMASCPELFWQAQKENQGKDVTDGKPG